MSTKVITNKENNDKLKAKWGKLPADARLETSGAPFRALGRTLRITNRCSSSTIGLKFRRERFAIL